MQMPNIFIPPFQPYPAGGPPNDEIVLQLVMAKGRLWDGVGPYGGSKSAWICSALKQSTSPIATWLCFNVIEPRLYHEGDRSTFYTRWIMEVNGGGFFSSEAEQAGRLAWLDALIEEFSLTSKEIK